MCQPEYFSLLVQSTEIYYPKAKHTNACIKHRVAITLWCLATCAEYRTIGHLFDVARCSVCVIVHDTCAAIVNVLQSQYIQFPVGDKLTAMINGFKVMWNVPQCAGAIDGSHIPVPGCLPTHKCIRNL